MVRQKNSAETIIEHYNRVNEGDRLNEFVGKLEYARTLDLLDRFLPKPPSVILDVGGATGVYSFWLAEKGYTVHLIDPVLKHIEQARYRLHTLPGSLDVNCRVGDGRDLDVPDQFADVILSFGPLYHLTEKQDRIASLKEAHRALKPGGMVLAVVVSRFASLFDGFFHGYIDDPAFVEIVRNDLEYGQHRNPTDNPIYWTDAYFHHPDELTLEFKEAGFVTYETLAIDGFGCFLHDFDERWNDPGRRSQLLHFMRKTETDPTIIGLSAHIMGIGRKNRG